LQHSNWRFLVVALFFECLWLYNVAITYGVLYRLVGLREDKKRLLLVSAAANFINVVAPSAGIGGMAVFLDDAKRRNHSSGRVTVVGALFVLFDYIAFLCVLALGWIVLIQPWDWLILRSSPLIWLSLSKCCSNAADGGVINRLLVFHPP
jgi:uncharacterized membrane protein YbhN (UPF0104 family)